MPFGKTEDETVGCKSYLSKAMVNVRRRLDISQHQAANLLGVSIGAISHAEASPTEKLSVKIALGFIFISPDKESAIPFVEYILSTFGETTSMDALNELRERFLTESVGTKKPE